MSEPFFLSFEEVQALHALSIERYGGLHGIRDRGGVEAAVEQPKNTFYYGGGDLFDVAAAYAFHIAQAQAFLDGNKRTGIGAALAFLERNNCRAIFDWPKKSSPGFFAKHSHQRNKDHRNKRFSA